MAIVGLIGNIMSVLVLSMEEMKNCFNSLLIVLAMFDTIFIILVTLDYSFVRGFKINQIFFSFLQSSTLYNIYFPNFINTNKILKPIYI